MVSEKIKAKVHAGNISHIRDALINITARDKSFSTGDFDEALQYVESAGVQGIYDEFDGDEFLPREKWTDDYRLELAASLYDNFCRERIEKLKEVSRALSATNVAASAAPVAPKTTSRPTHTSPKKARPMAQPAALAAMAVAAIIGIKAIGWKTGILAGATVLGISMFLGRKK